MRQNVNFRVSEAGLNWIDRLAEQYPDLTRADVLRASLVVARQYENRVKSILEEQQ